MPDPFTHCQQLVRAADKDRFIASLFAPAGQRGALFALYAFNVEVSRVREAVREPLAGEIRLQWWRDLLAGEGRGEVAANPVAAALTATIERYRLPAEPFAALLEARRLDLYDEPMRTLAELEAYAEGASVSLIALAVQVLDPGRAPDLAPLTRHAGLAHATGGLLRAFPQLAARGQRHLPFEVLERHRVGGTAVASRQATPPLRAALAELRLYARRHLDWAQALMRAAPSSVVPALLPVALVRPTLARMDRSDYDPFVPVELAPWRRQWLIWRAARRPERVFG